MWVLALYSEYAKGDVHKFSPGKCSAHIYTDLNLLTCCWLQYSKINNAREIRQRVKGVDFPALARKKMGRVAQRKRAGPITQRLMD